MAEPAKAEPAKAPQSKAAPAKAAPKKGKKTSRPYKPAKACPKCGSRMGEHANRNACGKCGYTELKSVQKADTSGKK